ncbi:MAG: nitrogen regulation protein NR(II) [Arenicellales bacterium]
MDCSRILHNLATCVVLLDREYGIQYLNESAETLMNTSLNRASGMQLYKLIRADQQLLTACEKVLEGCGEMRLRNHELTLTSHVTEKQVDCIINRIDLDDRVMLMLELNEIEGVSKITRDEEFLQRHQSNQAIIRGLAHEIRNPLGGIRGAAQLMADEAGSEEFIEYTRIIIRETDRLTSLVNRMQSQTRVDLEQRVNIHQVIEHVRQLVMADGEPLFKMEFDYDPSLPAVTGNQDLLTQAFMNVLRNAAEAVEAMGVKGVIQLRTRIDHLVLEGARKQVVRVDIIDNGEGIDDNLEPRIFDPMVTGKSNGTGLGLPITAEIVTQHNGALDFQSKPGQTVFRLFLPVHLQLQGNQL